ncbi:MAG: SDR family oxidoreductase [Steroidobacteraceae bacterium]
MSHIQGRVAVVTGASAGIGAAIARDLAAAGAKLVLSARRQDRLDALAAELGGSVATLAADIVDSATAGRLLELAKSRFGAVDILVNNAGILRVAPLDAVDFEAIEAMIAVNYTAVVRASYVFARAMKAQGSGIIVNLSSIGAGIVAPGVGVYGGLKRALEMFTDSLRIELVGTGVRAGFVAPGTTATEIFDDMKAHGQPAWDSYVRPLKPEDVARAVHFLLDQPPHAAVPRVHVYAAGDAF